MGFLLVIVLSIIGILFVKWEYARFSQELMVDESSIVQSYVKLIQRLPNIFKITQHTISALLFFCFVFLFFIIHTHVVSIAFDYTFVAVGSIVFIIFLILRFFPLKSERIRIIFLVIYIIVTIVILPISFLLFIVFQYVFPRSQIQQVEDTILIDSQIYASQDTSVKHEAKTDALKYFKNALEFSSVKLRECVIPRTELVTIQKHEKFDVLIQKFVSSGYSKVLVYEDSIDNIIGYIHSSDIFKNPISIDSIIRRIQFVPETMNAKKLLQQFISEKQSIAVVVDEFGGTAGIVTIEDIVEEIFGEIKDEYDMIYLEERVLSSTEYIFSGRHEIDFLQEKYHLQIPNTDDYETLAGFFLYYYQKFPHVNSYIVVNKIKFTVVKITGTRVELIRVKKL